MITKIIHNALIKQREAPRDYLGASSIGNPCSRAIWYGCNGYEAIFEPKTLVTFEIGKRLETMLLTLLHEGDWGVKKLKCKDVPKFAGSIDSHFVFGDVHYIIEVKTANNANLQKMSKQGIKSVRPEYIDQVQSYMGMSDIHKTVFLVINKDTSELYEEVIDFDKFAYELLISKAKRILASKVAPDRLNDNPMFYLCKMCAYKTVCHG